MGGGWKFLTGKASWECGIIRGMKKIDVLLICALAAVCANAEFSKAGYWAVEGSPRRVETLTRGWEFSLDGFKTSRAVCLPHSIDEGEIGFEASGCVNRQQPAWYRRRFTWRRSLGGVGSAHQFLHFEAIMGKSRITLNGKLVAEHFGGYLPIHAEVTGVLREGENLLEVWCDNSDDPDYPPGKPQSQLDFAYFGGIYRDAYLIETGEAYVADTDKGGVRVTSNLGADGKWTVTADVTLGGETDGAIAELSYDGRRVESPFIPESPALWTPEEPNLHMLRVDVRKGGRIVDSVGVRFGIRDFSFGVDGFTLNGKRYPKKLIGTNRHQDYLFIGNALPNSLHWRDVKKFKECGMTVFRNAHYPQDPAFMDACDELGMFVIVTTPGWQFWNRKNPDFERRVYDDIEKMVRRDRSRPSLLMWEPILNETHFPADFTTNAASIVRRETLPPNNQCACDRRSKGSSFFDVNYTPGDMSAEDASFAKPTFCREWGDFPDDWNSQNSSSRVAREWGEGPMAAQAWHYMHETYWPSLDVQRALSAKHIGGAIWHGTDHARGYHPDNFFGGIMTYARQKKYSWYAFKAALTEKPFVYVAHELAPCSPAEIPVYSNCAYSATCLGEPFRPGETKFEYWKLQRLEYYSKIPDAKKKACIAVTLPDGSTVVKRPAKRFAKIMLALDTEGLPPVADGSDLVALTATLADAEGNPKRYLTETVRFSVDGEAEVVGENPQRTRWGEAVVLIRPKATSAPKPITVRAELTRNGRHVPKGGELAFTPGALDVRTASGGGSDDSLRAVERQQREYNVQR